MYKIIKRIKAGAAGWKTLNPGRAWPNNMGIMPGTTICGLADGAAWPVKNALAKFRPEIEEYIRTHQTAGRGPSALQEAIVRGVPTPAPVGPSLPIVTAPAARLRLSDTRPEGKLMATILINGQEYPIPEGEKLNAIQMAKRVGVDIPYYCWHPALSVVANCRMCEIEVGSKDPKTGEIKMIPKLVPGCQTPAKDGTVIVTDSPKVQGASADDHGVCS